MVLELSLLKFSGISHLGVHLAVHIFSVPVIFHIVYILAAAIVCVSFCQFVGVSFWFLCATLVERFAALICLAWPTNTPLAAGERDPLTFILAIAGHSSQIPWTGQKAN